MLKILTVFLAILSSGCASMQSKPVLGPNGRPSYVVECLGKEQNCYPQAKKLCPQGYHITESKYRAVMNWQGFEMENTLKYRLVIECHE